MVHIHTKGARLENLSQNKRRLSLVLAITLVFALVEFAGGLISNSLALISDAGHMAIDAGAIALSLFAVMVSMRPPSDKNTFSLVRIEIIVAFVNGLSLMGIAFYIFYEAIQRIEHPPEIKGGIMLGVALLGLISMIVGAIILWPASHDNLNIKGAFLHIMGDLLGSVGAVAGGAVIVATGWTSIDTIVSVIIGLLIIYSSFGLIRDSLHILMEGTPRELDIDEVVSSINAIDGVCNVHDFHVWSLTTGVALLTAHVEVKEIASGTAILEKIAAMLDEQYNLHHVTIQIEDTMSKSCKVNC